MDALLSSILSYLLLYKYAALFMMSFSAALILPLPVNLALMAVGAFASQGYFNFPLSLVITVIANTLGDLAGYGLTHKWGEAVIRKLRIHKLRFYEDLQEEFRTDAAIAVFTTRFAGSLSPVANFLAGLVKVRFSTFVAFDFLGNLIEPFAALSAGQLVGIYWIDFSNLLSIMTGIIAAAVTLFVLGRIYERITKRRKSRKNPKPENADPPSAYLAAD